MDQEKDYLEMIKDTSYLVAQEKAAQLGDLAVAFQSSERLTNDVEFWRWIHFRKAAKRGTRLLRTVLRV